ncbi:unnamed protein product [Spirodela intermedia]|uniref:Uncharacterized protein n=1 Tax=Spirodela intermedia TaxID=51605 RepID=A0A7I8LHI7_SPIIN|nr:unnamed protein product [Spirodela intermedia]
MISISSLITTHHCRTLSNILLMLDPLLFYVLPNSVSILMLYGAEYLLFAGMKLFLCRGLVQ